MTIAAVVTFGSSSTASFLVSTNPPNVYSSGAGGGTQTTSAMTAAISGGTAPYTYSWSIVSGDSITITSPTAGSTTFSGSVPFGGTLFAVVRVTVTDANGATSQADGTATLMDIGFVGGPIF